MKEIHDLIQLTVSSKHDEKMIGFVSFSFRPKGSETRNDGILKISASDSRNQRNYLTLTFIADAGEEKEANDYLKNLFAELSEESLKEYLGKAMGALIKIPLDAFSSNSNFFIEELNIYLNFSGEPDRYFFENELLPGIAKILSLNFDSIEWFNTDNIDKEIHHQPQNKKLLPSKAILSF